MNYQGPDQPPQYSDRRDLMPAERMGVPQEYRQDGLHYPYYSGYDTAIGQPEGFDYYRYLRILSKYRWLILGITFSVMLLAAAVTFLMTPVYRSTSSIQIDRQSMEVVDVKSLQPEEGANNQEFYQTQYELLGSRSLAERVVTTLGLASDPVFNRKQAGLLQTIKGFVLGRSTDADGQSLDKNVEKTIDRLKDALTVTPVRGSRIVKLSIDHTDPATAQKIANGYAEVFIADNLDRRFDATSYARKFLEGRLEQLKAKLEDSEKQLVKYAEDQGIINLDDNKNLTTTDLESVNAKLAEARSERIKRELLWKQAQVADGFGLKEILDSPAIQENRKLRTQLAAQYQQKLAIFKPAFPEMVELRNQIKELDRQAQSEITAIKSSIQASYLAAKSEEEQLAAQLDQTKGSVVDQRNRSIEYNILKREVDTNRTLYEGLLQRYKEIGVAGGVGTNNVSIVDKATKPIFPRSPNLFLNLALGLVGGLLLGLLTALARDFFDDTFKSPEDIEREVGIAVVGIIPKPAAGSTMEEELVNPRSSVAEAIRSLRTGLQFSTSNGLPQTLFVTSSKPSEGKTTTSIAVARSLAQIGLNVLLVDADLRNPSVHRRLSLSNERGLSNYLAGGADPEDLVQATDTGGLVFMASGPMPPNPAELLSSPRLHSLIHLAVSSFDILIIDGPPIMGLADAPLLASVAQSTLLVVAANETRKSMVKIAFKRLQFARANIIGALLNKFDTKEVDYGYGYGDYQYHSQNDVGLLPSGK